MKSNKRVLMGIICSLMATCNGTACAVESGSAENNSVMIAEATPNANSSENEVVVGTTLVKKDVCDCNTCVTSDDMSLLKNGIPLKISFSPEFEKASVDMMNSVSNAMQSVEKSVSAMSEVMSNLNTCVVDTQSSVSDPITVEDFEKDKTRFYPACVALKTDQFCSEPIYYTIRWQETLKGIARNLLGSVEKADMISGIPENAKFVSSASSKDYLQEGECLKIPQPEDAGWVLYCPKDKENYYDIARVFYGSWVYAPTLAKFNDSNYPDSIYENVIRLPKVLSLNSYTVSDGETPLKISRKLFGSDKYALSIVELNELTDVNKPLKRGESLKMPYVEQNFIVV